jgi:phage tail protein X
MTEIARETFTVSSDGMSVDLIIWQRFRRPMLGLFERIMALPENQHLEHCGFVLPLGVAVTIPIAPPPREQELPVISLWD